MSQALQQGVVVLCSLLLFSPPLSAANEWIGVARVSGRAGVNGLSLPDGTNLYSGDRVTTEGNAHLRLVSSPEEKIHLLPQSSAGLSKRGDITIVALRQGSMNFRSGGHTHAVLEKYGIEIRPAGEYSAIVQVVLSNPGQAQVAALRGSVEVRAPIQVVHLKAGDRAVISSASTGPVSPLGRASVTSGGAQEEPAVDVGSITGTVVDANRTAIAGARVTLTTQATGTSRTVVTNAAGGFSFTRVPPGSHNLEISHKGFRTYELKDLVVQAGRESSLGLIMLERGVGKKAAIAVAVIGGAGAAIAIPLIFQDGEAEVVSPSSL